MATGSTGNNDKGKDTSANDGHESGEDSNDGWGYAEGFNGFNNEPQFFVQSNMPLPAPFSFKSEDWLRWRNRWTRFVFGSGLVSQPDEIIVNQFVYAMGDKAEDLLLSFKLAPADEINYKKLLAKFDDHFGVRKNVVFERQRFLRRKQESGESVDDFIADLHRLANTCEFKDMKDEFIRDALINGIRDRRLSDSLALDRDMTLAKAAARIRQKEELQRNKTEQPGGSRGGTSDVGFVRAGGGRPQRQQRRDNNNKGSGGGSGKPGNRDSGKECGKCGRSPQHAFSACPAKKSTCGKCKRTGHWAAKCGENNKNVHKVENKDDSSDDDDELFVGAITLCGAPRVARVHAVGSGQKRRPPWMTEVSVAGRELRVQVDSGADVTVVSKKTFEETFPGVKLQSTAHRLRGPDRKRLSVVGVWETPIVWRGRSAATDIYVIEEDAVSLLGRPAIEDLSMIRWDPDAVVGAATQEIPTETPPGAWVKEFPEVFQGLGCINEERPYTIVLKEGAQPHAVTAPRRVSVPFREEVRAELQRMVKMGVISPVDEATEWCAPRWW